MGALSRPLTDAGLKRDKKWDKKYKRSYAHSAEKWLERASNHPDFDSLVFDDEDPATDDVLRGLLTKGLFCQSAKDFDAPSWYTLAQDRRIWNEVCLAADHELRGQARSEKRQKKQSKDKAKVFRLNADAAIWQLF